MRIGFFTDSYLPAVHGVEISIESFRKALEAMGHEVYIYAPESPGYKDTNPRVFRFKSKRVLRNPEMRFAIDFLPVGHSFKEISRFKLDIAHAHSPFGLGFLAKYISERQLIPLIYTHHTHYPEYTKIYLKEKIFLPYLAKIYTAWFSNLSHAIIAPSPKMKKLLRDYGVKKSVPINILPTGIDLEIFQKSLKNRQTLRKKLKISSETKVILSVSRIAKEKNIEFLLKAFVEILNKKKDILFLLVGGGPFLEQAKKMAQNLKIDKNIIFTGNVPSKEVPSYYQASDVFVFASLTDTQGIVLLEALSCGLPIVALKDDAFTGVVLNHKNGFLVSKHTPRVFAKKVINLLDDALLYKKFSDAATKIVEKFSDKNLAKDLIEIYKAQIIKERGIKKEGIKHIFP